MEKVTGHTNLFRRNATYYLRRRVPSDILDSFGKKELCYSLKTKDYQEALKRIRIEAAKVESQFEEHRQELKRLSSPPLEDLSLEQLQNIHDVYYQFRLEEDDGTRLEGFYRGEMTETPVPSFEEYKEDIDTFEHATRGDYAEGVPNEFYLSEAMEVLSWSEVSLNVTEGSLAHKKVARKIQEATIRAYESIQSRNKGSLVDTPDRPQKPLSESLSASNAPLLSEVMEEWIKDKSRSEWKPNTAKSHRIWVEYFIGMAGDRPIDDYTKADARAFKETLLSLPANWKKKKELKKLSNIQVAAKRATELNIKPKAEKTAKDDLNRVSSLWRWALGHYDEVEKDIFAGIKIKVNAQAQDARDPFSTADLKKIFSAPLYTGCLSKNKTFIAGSYSLKNSVKYWAPIIALYSGMRLAEITQLHIDDIKEENGTYYFDIKADETTGRTLKTQNSIRQVPMHRMIIEAGFLNYVDSRKGKTKALLFSDVERGSDGTYSGNYSKYFARFLESLNIKTSKKTFHSFRHNFQDSCRDAGVPWDIREILAGRQIHNTSEIYGSGYSLHKLNEWLQKVDYGECVGVP